MRAGRGLETGLRLGALEILLGLGQLRSRGEINSLRDGRGAGEDLLPRNRERPFDT